MIKTYNIRITAVEKENLDDIDAAQPVVIALNKLSREISKGINDSSNGPWDMQDQGWIMSWEIDYPENEIEMLKTGKERLE